jgi:hypothetical protein
MKSLKLFCCSVMAFCGISGLYAKFTVEESIDVLKMMIQAKPIVSAHVVYADTEAKNLWAKFSAVREKIARSSYSEEQKEASYPVLADRFGSQLLNSTKKFFDVLHEFKSPIEPIVEAGLKEKSIDINKAVLMQFLQAKDEDIVKVEARIKTVEGFVSVVEELRILFTYFYRIFPDVEKTGKEYLENLKKEAGVTPVANK